MGQCTTGLQPMGFGFCKFKADEIKRFGFVATYKEDGTKNSISETNAVLLSNWQTLFNKHHFASDRLELVAMTPTFYAVKPEQSDGDVYSNAGYEEKTREGDYDFTMVFENANPDQVRWIKEYEDINFSMYLFDNEGRVIGEKNGTTVYPIEVQNIQCKNFQVKGFDTPNQAPMIRIRLKDPNIMNKINSYQILDASGNTTSIRNEDQYYSMLPSSGATTSPATTGATIVITTDDVSGAAVTDILYDDWNFHPTDNSGDVTLAGAGSVTESPDGTYAISEVALLTSGKTYEVEITYDKYDIVVENIVVP